MIFDTILQSMQCLFSPTSYALMLILLIVDTVIIVFAITVFLCDWFTKTVGGIVYHWKHRNDPSPKGMEFGIALGTLQGFVCFGCPELKNVRYCAVCRLKRDEKKGEEK